MRATIDRWVAATLAIAVIVAVATARPISGDWTFFVERAHQMLTTSGLHVYADHTDIQSGPLALLAVVLVDSVGPLGLTAAIALTGAATVWCIVEMRTERSGVCTLLGGLVLAAWWPLLRQNGHLDDALALLLSVGAIALVRSDRRMPAAVLLGLAIAVKPWIVFMLPVTLRRAPDGSWRARSATPLLVSVAVASLCWAPFLLADAGSLESLRPNVSVRPDSVLALLGIGTADVGPALRLLQLAGATALVAIAVLRGRIGAALLVGVAARLLLEPATWSYYTVGLVVGALVWDVVESDRDVPWATIAVSLLVLPRGVVTPPEVAGLLRAVACTGAIALAMWPHRDAPATTGYGRRGWTSRRSTPLATPSASTSSSTASSVVTSP